MYVNRKKIAEINKVVSKYNGWRTPKEIANMYDELSLMGVETGVLYYGDTSCEWYLNGERVDNSRFIYRVTEGTDEQNEYLMYFS